MRLMQAAENRQTVIDVASRLLRERGFDGIGPKDLMKGGGGAATPAVCGLLANFYAQALSEIDCIRTLYHL